ncbi:MAG: hypothetical protein V7459_04620 [Oceanicoccus sp.]
MDQQLYDIVFSGQLVSGVSAESAQTKLAALFNSSADNIARIFNGKTQALKRGVNKADALKYKAAFHQAGLIVSFTSHQLDTGKVTLKPTHKPADQPQSSREAPPTEPRDNKPAQQHQVKDEDWSVAPAGSDVLQQHERKTTQAQSIDTSAIKMVSAFFEPEMETATPPDPPDTSQLSVAAAGEDLLIEKHQPPTPLSLDIDDLSLAPAGSSLEELPDTRTPLNPNTDYLSIAEAGVDLVEIRRKEAAIRVPATDHLSIERS